MKHEITLRPGSPADVGACAAVCFEAFSGISNRHGFPPDFASEEVARGLMEFVLNQPEKVYSVVAEAGGRIVGSCFLWEGGPVAGVGPVTVDPGVQARSVGRRMMEAVLARARERRFAGVRLLANETRNHGKPLKCHGAGPALRSASPSRFLRAFVSSWFRHLRGSSIGAGAADSDVAA